MQFFLQMKNIEKLLVITIASISLLTISSVSADSSMSVGSMTHDDNMSNYSMTNDKMMDNMSGSGWGNNGTMMKGENMMMANGKIDLSMSSPRSEERRVGKECRSRWS